MKRILLLPIVSLITFLLQAQSGSWQPVSPKTIVISKDTFLRRMAPLSTYSGGGGAQFLICKGVRVYYMDTAVNDPRDTFLLEENAELYMDSIYKPKIFYGQVFGAPNSLFEARDPTTTFGVVGDSSMIIRGPKNYPSLSKWTKNSSGDYYDYSLFPGGLNPCKNTAGVTRIIHSESIQIQPNPSNGIFYLRGAPEKSDVQVLDATGRKMPIVLEKESGGWRISVNASKGIYFVRVQDSVHSQTLRVVLE